MPRAVLYVPSIQSPEIMQALRKLSWPAIVAAALTILVLAYVYQQRDWIFYFASYVDTSRQLEVQLPTAASEIKSLTDTVQSEPRIVVAKLDEDSEKKLRIAREYFEFRGYKFCELASRQKWKSRLWPQLRRPASQTCDATFRRFLEVAKEIGDWPPPKQMPAALTDAYTMHSRAKTTSWYVAQRYEGALIPYTWTVDFVGDYIARAKRNESFGYGPDETQLIYDAMRSYDLKGQRGIVVGSEAPWIEAILIAHGGVASVLTVEYHPINASHPQVEHVHPITMSESWQKYAERNFSFAFSFSSLEHSGLGRYGDKLDPDGDLNEVQKLACILPDGALLFLGFPIGVDEVAWNAHRTYGRWRLPLMTANFEVLALYTDSRFSGMDPLDVVVTNPSFRQGLIVAKNVKSGSSC